MPLSTVYTGCGGENRSPALHWTGAPHGTKSFALIVHDPDAPHAGGWYHWVAFNIPASASGIPSGRSYDAGTNDFGKTEYDGPCPPPGKPHHYRFTLYALKVPAFKFRHAPAGPELEQFLRDKTIAKTTLIGIYGR
ncbi:MAG TPA: YbhB/YbcL family Raf kinase inhibitor-like protein [Candidatus Baltobacteraceae bacterium]|nr:YbhB/YbcL family Raf kinase inhibitor-like protein [Candidatus Baltobacteraceae bacterium]